MALPSFKPKATESDAAQTQNFNAVAATPASQTGADTKIVARDVHAVEAAPAISQPGSNPVAEVQAKLRAALAEEKQKDTGAAEFFFRTLMTFLCVTTTVLGLVVGVACVFLGTAIYLFPVSAGLTLAAVVVGSGYLAYRTYTGSPKEAAARRPIDKAADIFEPLAAGRFNVA